MDFRPPMFMVRYLEPSILLISLTPLRQKLKTKIMIFRFKLMRYQSKYLFSGGKLITYMCNLVWGPKVAYNPLPGFRLRGAMFQIRDRRQKSEKVCRYGLRQGVPIRSDPRTD